MKSTRCISTFLWITIFLTSLVTSTPNCQNSSPTNLTLTMSPGEGWDGLLAITKDRMVSVSFSKCLTTPDNRFLLPDHAHATVVKNSRVQLYSTLFDRWSDYLPLTASSFNEGRRNLFGGPSDIGGTFSQDVLEVKEKQIKGNCKMLRVAIKVVQYSLSLGQDFDLQDDLKTRLMEVNGHLDSGNELRARYLAEKIVEDYGTHLVSKIDLGAMIVEENCVGVEFIKKNLLSDVTGSANIEFLKLINFRSKDITEGINPNVVAAYKKSRVFSSINTFGGYRLHSNMSVDKWIDNVDKDLIIVDRQGELLHHFIVPSLFDELGVGKVKKLRDLISDVVGRYYEYNEHKGCTIMTAWNFDYTANIDDGSCGKKGVVYPFGGFFQLCKTNATSNETNPCYVLNQTNPLTNGYSCPEYFTPTVLLDYKDTLTEVKTSSPSKPEVVALQVVWCANSLDTHSENILYGGSFSRVVPNPVTGSFSCPHQFFKTRLSYDVIVCLSIESLSSDSSAVPFGGFFSCVHGNPQQPISQIVDDDYSHECPVGYSEHVISFTNDCYIKQCVNTSIFQNSINLPLIGPTITESEVVFDRDNFDNPSTSPSPNSSQLGASGIAAVILGCLLVLVLAGVLFVVVKKKRETKSRSEEEAPNAGSSNAGYERMPESSET